MTEIKKKSGPSRLTIIFLALVGLCLISYVLSPKQAATPTPAPGATAIPIAAAPAATRTPAPAATPIPQPTATPLPVISNITLADIVAHRKNDTDLQWKAYVPTVVGKRVQWKGTVSQVAEDGRVIIEVAPAPPMWSVYLEGLSKETLLTMNKGQVLQVEATIKVIDGLLGLSWVTLTGVVIR